MIISFISQKGGVSRSTLARATATEFAKAGWQVHLADLDTQQQTSSKWAERRDLASLTPSIETAVYRRHNVALKAAALNQLLLIDTRPFADISSVDIAEASDLIVIATGTSLDDLEPSLLLGREFLQKRQIPLHKILFVVCKAPSIAEGQAAQRTISAWGFQCAYHFIRFMPGYSQALDAGKSITETHYPTLNAIACSIIDEIASLINS